MAALPRSNSIPARKNGLRLSLLRHRRCRVAESAAITLIPGAIFFHGSWDGVVRAFSTSDGRLLWEYNTMRDFETVNHVPAKKAGLDGSLPGATVVDGTVFVGSGYDFATGIPGNVLLAFSAQ